MHFNMTYRIKKQKIAIGIPHADESETAKVTEMLQLARPSWPFSLRAYRVGLELNESSGEFEERFVFSDLKRALDKKGFATRGIDYTALSQIGYALSIARNLQISSREGEIDNYIATLKGSADSDRGYKPPNCIMQQEEMLSAYQTASRLLRKPKNIDFLWMSVNFLRENYFLNSIEQENLDAVVLGSAHVRALETELQKREFAIKYIGK